MDALPKDLFVEAHDAPPSRIVLYVDAMDCEELYEGFRCAAGLAGTELAKAQCGTIRDRVLKVGAQARVGVRPSFDSTRASTRPGLHSPRSTRGCPPLGHNGFLDRAGPALWTRRGQPRQRRATRRRPPHQFRGLEDRGPLQLLACRSDLYHHHFGSPGATSTTPAAFACGLTRCPQ